jgi:hypothetical protein
MPRTYRKTPISELAPSKAFKMKLDSIWMEALSVEYEFKRKAAISRHADQRSNDTSFRNHLPVQPETGS